MPLAEPPSNSPPPVLASSSSQGRARYGDAGGLKRIWDRVPAWALRLPLLAFMLAASLGSVEAQELLAVDGARANLRDSLDARKTLLLVAKEEADINESFRLLTLAEAKNLPALILVELPAGQPLKAAAIKSGAKRFFKSDYSRQRIFFITEQSANDAFHQDLRSALLDESATVRWSSSAYPSDAHFESLAFRP